MNEETHTLSLQTVWFHSTVYVTLEYTGVLYLTNQDNIGIVKSLHKLLSMWHLIERHMLFPL